MEKICKVENCNNSSDYKNRGRAGYCCRHCQQIYNHGKILKRTVYDKNEIIKYKDYAEIILYNRKCEEVARTIIDLEDIEKCSKHKWYLCNYGYVVCKNTKINIKLHQLIFGKKEGFDIDHRDTNPLNNRKNNLRHCTHQENMMNRKCKGYYWSKRHNRWIAEIKFNYKKIHLGCFKTEIEAKEIRKQAVIKYFGEFGYNTYT